MSGILKFIKKEPVLIAGTILMIASMFLVPPSKTYLDYIDFRVLALLFCLMAVVAGLKKLGMFDKIAQQLGKCVKTVRSFTFLMCIVCFFVAMLITNDVALITFVPLTLLMLRGQKEKTIIITIVLETVAVNLGSMLTPIGNPQNLYLFSQSGVSIAQFLLWMLPVTAVSLFLVMISALFTPKTALIIDREKEDNKKTAWFKIVTYLLLFMVCLLNVFHVLDYPLVLAIVFLSVLIMDPKVLLNVDYCLLLTFVTFFIFIGNIGAIPKVHDFLQSIILGRELLLGVATSQVFSNVPAAMLLEAFTKDYRALLWGVNIGGLGTLIASMASLISYKFYAAESSAKKGRYLIIFTIINVIFLAVLLLFAGAFFVFFQ